MRWLVVRVCDFNERQSSSIVSSTGIDSFDGEPVNFEDVGFCNSSSAVFYKFCKVIHNVCLIGNLKSLFLVRGTEEGT